MRPSSPPHDPVSAGLDEAGYRAFFEALDQGFCLVETVAGGDGGIVDVRILDTNAAFAAESGLPDAHGRSLRELMPDADGFWIEAFAGVARTGTPLRIERLVEATGRRLDVHVVRLDALRGRLGVLLRDVTAAHEAQARLRDGEERLRIAVDAADLGTWEYDFATQRTDARSLRHDQMFGYASLQPEWTLDVAVAHVLPEDRPLLLGAMQRAMREGVYACEVRIRRADGEVRWIAPLGRTRFDDAGRPVRMTGVVADITERKEAEQALRRSEERFRLMAESAPQIVWITDGAGRVEFLSHQWHLYTGLADTPRNAQEISDWSVHPDDREPTFRNFQIANDTRATFRIEHRIRGADGEYRWFLVRARPQLDPRSGDVLHWYGASVDIHDRVLAEQRLAEADRHKDEFLAMLAHELRNPLAPISTAALLLERLGVDDPRVRHVGEIVGRQASHMRSLIDDLLDVARVTQGRITLQQEVLDMATLVANAIEQTRPQVEARGHVLDVELDAAPMPVCGDRVRLVQTLTNLIDNAAKYTPPGGAIRVQARNAGGEVQVEVCDTGIGIEPSLLPTVFDLFKQGARTPDRSHGGLGLGLALVRMLVQLHGGQVEAASEGPGRGSTFRLRLPRVEASATPATAAVPRPAGAPRRICVVDDNRDAAESLGALLRELGHEVRVHFAAESLLASLPRESSEVYILDIGLPGMDGHALARQLRARPGGGSARLIALTGYGQPADVERSLEAGFDDHVVKPVDVGRLQALLA